MPIYKVDFSGATTGKSGKRIEFDRNEPVECAKGDLNHLGDHIRMITQSTKAVVIDSDKRDKPLDGTVKEIKKWLDDNGVDYDSDALKAELLKVLKDA